jgi:hypothetical protein
MASSEIIQLEGDEAEVKEFVKEISRIRREENKKNKKK